MAGAYKGREKYIQDGWGDNASRSLMSLLRSLFVEGFAMHGVIPSDLADDFMPQIKEGHFYKIRIFEVVPRLRKTHLVVPLETELFFNVSTQINEVREGVSKFPDYYFKFASYDQVMIRNEKCYCLTDVIVVLGQTTDVKPIVLNNNKGSVDKRDIFLTLISGKKIRITVCDPKILELDITGIIRMGYKPVLAIDGLYIKDNSGNKQINTCSTTKFYLDIDIHEACDVRKRISKISF
ncbi:Nucleic acid-binding protein [Corchorus capsularis]|uniref:Nucleic acid-binding protein n=1 Tax=Corchorus capsularis TaxID=210143 RepID=A0A1R3FYT0_COCAP|nr:Nucleic acid-binding protein [Corchorus capsularis]